MRFDLDHIFRHHPPQGSDANKYNVIRMKAREFAEAILAVTPEGADQGDAIRKVREAAMTANAAIALRGRLGPENHNYMGMEPEPTRTEACDRTR